MSHELRTPLTSISGSLGLLVSGAAGALSDQGVEVVAIAERNAVRLIALINDILDVERLETGTIELQFAQVSVESILRRAMEMLSDREYAVMARIGAGKGVKEIGDELSLSEKTIRTHRARVLEKLRVKNTAEIVQCAIRNGLVTEHVPNAAAV